MALSLVDLGAVNIVINTGIFSFIQMYVRVHYMHGSVCV